MKKVILKFLYATGALSLMFCNDERVRERPKEIIATGARTEVYQKIMSDFPEYQSIKSNKSELFASAAGKQVVLTTDSEIYVTFISEGAGYPNTFGWYSYTPSSKPGQPADVKLNVLFPHVSDRVLRQGDMLKLSDSKFPAGTVIGFFLIIRGWDNGTIRYDRQTFYTNSEFNDDDQQQHVLFKQKDLGDVVLAFEDQLTSQESDEDFNDIIFTVTDNRLNNPVTNFDLKNVVEL